MTRKCPAKHQTRNTKHMMNSTLYEFIMIGYWNLDCLVLMVCKYTANLQLNE